MAVTLFADMADNIAFLKYILKPGIRIELWPEDLYLGHITRTIILKANSSLCLAISPLLFVTIKIQHTIFIKVAKLHFVLLFPFAFLSLSAE